MSVILTFFIYIVYYLANQQFQRKTTTWRLKSISVVDNAKDTKLEISQVISNNIKSDLLHMNVFVY